MATTKQTQKAATSSGDSAEKSSEGTSKKATAKKSATKQTATKKSATKKSAKRSAPKAESRPAAKASEVAAAAARELLALTGKQVEGVTGLDRTDDGWTVQVEVVEVRRIPDTTDVLALYEIETDRQGALQGYRRLRRYARGVPGEE